ncbi:Oligopeptidase A [Leminorella richardii]|uniref:Oligopeptidase A n=1 Tax=Leminorella richardii TaxID=158841 RepID=A0A2X4U750_9GAMM|nr:Oligopeptidase A [Leminorella richardii]
MTNPLLTSWALPPFSSIRPEDIVPAVNAALDDCRAAVERVVAQPGRLPGKTCVSR